MRIFKEREKISIDFLSKYIFYLKKRNSIKIILFLFFCFFIFLPIDFFNSSNKGIRYGGEFIAKTIGVFDKKTESLAREVFYMGDNIFGITFRYLKAFTNKQETLSINLSFENSQKLKKIRNNAIKKGILVRSKNDKVKGYIDYLGKRYPIQIRLKGDWTDHLLGEKWSFRIETKKKNAFLGMREFSLQHPRTRNYLNEFVLHKLLKYENLPYLRYKFIPVSLNGKYLGIYALEEHFSKELIENSNLREGPILKISDQDKRNEWNRNSELINNSNLFLNTTQNNADILTFNLDAISKKEEKISQFQLAKNLFNEFLKNQIKTSEIFDLNMTAKYFAITDLMQSTKANTWYDMRFYYDPILARIVPIGYDAQIPYIIKNRLLSIDQNVLSIFDDPIFLKEYLKELNRISELNYIDNFFNKIDNEINKEKSILNKSFPFVSFNKNEIYKNRKYIRNRLFRLKPIGISNINLSKESKFISIDFFNKNKLPLNIGSIIINKNKYYPISNNILPGESNYKRVRNYKIDFVASKKEKNEKIANYLKNQNINKQLLELIINYQVLGINQDKSITIKKLQNLNVTQLANPLIKRDPTYKLFKFLDINNVKKEISIKKDLNIKKPLILPEGYKLIIHPGVKINIINNGLILVKGPLLMNGNEKEVIVINSLQGGKGISIINSNESSYINYSQFNGLDSNSTISTNTTGGLSFYNSKVEIKNAKFINSLSEDALNLIRSPFIIKNSHFKNINQDAIDLDFSDGEIIDSTFSNIGNDSVDISGSLVFLNNLDVKSSGDKAISVGEKSKVFAENINVNDVFIGIASKDYSKIFLKNFNTKNTKFCMAAYKKKEEYGPGFIKVENSNCKRYILEPGSSIISSEYSFTPNVEKAYEKLYSK